MSPKMRKKTQYPKRCYESNGSVYYVESVGKKRKWHRLGKIGDDEAIYAALSKLRAHTNCLNDQFDRYRREILPQKAISTQKTQSGQLKKLSNIFGRMDPHNIKSTDIAQYLDRRPAKFAANREISLLSHVYTKMIRWGVVESNPCTGVEKNKESHDKRYIEHWELEAFCASASGLLRDACMLAYLIGQRQSDVMGIRLRDITDTHIFVQQNKTEKKLSIVRTEAVDKVLRSIRGSNTGVASLTYLFQKQDGSKYTVSAVRSAFKLHMRKCLENGTLTESFTFRAIRAKSRSDGEDKKLLGHSDPEKMARIYQRTAVEVKPVK